MAEPFVIFKIDGSSYAVRSAQIQQVEMVETVTRVPNTPEFVEGVVYLRGEVVPVINLRRRFGLEKAPYDIQARLVVIRLGQRPVALAVDSAREFIFLDETKILPPPESLHGPGVEYLEGVISFQDRLILVVDLQQLLNLSEKKALAESAERSQA